MLGFKSKKDREDERKAEFIAFLQSTAGRRTISEITVDIVNSKFTPIVNDVQGQLLKSANDQLLNFQGQLQGVSAAEIAVFTAYADEMLETAKGQFVNFLRSEEGKRLMLGLLTEALARGELAPILSAAQTRLKNLAADEIATFMAHAEISLKASAGGHAVAVRQQKAKFDSHANEITRDLAHHVISDVETHLSARQTEMIEGITDRANQQIDWLLEELPTRLRDAVDRHVRSGPRFSTPGSNRELAAAYGISIREVKRWRRDGRLPR